MSTVKYDIEKNLIEKYQLLILFTKSRFMCPISRKCLQQEELAICEHIVQIEQSNIVVEFVVVLEISKIE